MHYRLLARTFVVVSGISAAIGHAVVTTPTPRKTGPAHKALCGDAVVTQLESDKAGPIENAMAQADANYKCNAYLCRGYQYADNMKNVHQVKAGDVIDFHVDLVAAHRPGYANVSVVDTGSNTVIGEPLLTWPFWPCNTANPCDNKVDFNVTILSNLGSKCGDGGKCVIQWYWWSDGNKQTYESCVDFKVVS